jgi:hypothetical protein
MSDLFICIYSGGGGREVYEKFGREASYNISGTCVLIHLTTSSPSSRAQVAQPVIKFPGFYVTQRCITEPTLTLKSETSATFLNRFKQL